MMNNNEAKLMADEIRRFISDRCDKKELSLLNDKPDKKGRGGNNHKLEKLAGNLVGKTNEQLVVITKSKKEKEQTPLEFQRAKYQQYLFLLDEFKLDNRLIDTVQEYQEALQVLKQEHKPSIWLNYWADKARDISFATHVAKLTHSSSKSTSIYDRSTSKKPGYLTTSSIRGLIIDTATANAASAPAGDVLALEINNKSLLDFIKENNPDPFNELTENELEIESWMSSFKQAYEKDRKNSHFLSKQVFFPINEDKYHLLLPLVSSSMAYALYLKFQKFIEENKQVGDQKKNNKYHSNFVVSFSNKATLRVPGKPQTASSLNQERRGLLTLLPSFPQKWTKKQTLPLHQTSLFDRNMGYKLREEIKELQDLLRVIKAKEIGLKKPEMYRSIVKNVNIIAQALFDEITKINLISEQKGWTVNSGFPVHQQLLLEPAREDETAVVEKNNSQWLERIADDFSAWLNAQLKHKTLNLTPVQQRLWKDIFSPVLREYIAVQEAK